MNYNLYRKSMLVCAICLLPLLHGCFGDVSSVYKLSEGEDPSNENKNVRFRTTYYFRVFDVCPVQLGAKFNRNDESGRTTNYGARMGVLTSRENGPLVILRDSLYRFRMTGKGSAYFSNVRFESGILRADQIDPFGVQIEYNEAQRKFMPPPASNGQPSVPEPISVSLPNNTDGAECPDGNPSEQIFMLLGPEGIKRLNKNERLVLAMYNDSKPIISLLRQVGGKPEQELGQAQGLLTELGKQHLHLTSFNQRLKEVETTLQRDPSSPDVAPNALMDVFSGSTSPLQHTGKVLQNSVTGGQP